MTDHPIQIRNPDVVRAIREVAAKRGQPITEALGDMAKAELSRLASDEEARVQDRLRIIRESVERFNALPIVGPLLTDDDLYDEDGLPK
jgi:hypothetical protein